MRYLIYIPDQEPFFTKWFDIENNFIEDVEMVVFDLINNKYFDGEEWKDIESDHL